MPKALYPLRPSDGVVLVSAYDSQEYGAEQADFFCDGVNDEIEILQAIQSLPASGGEVRLSDGTFKIDASLVSITQNARIRLIGYGSVLKLAAGVTGIQISQGVASAIGARVEGLVIDGQSNANTTGILLMDTNNPSVELVRIINCATGLKISSYAANQFVEGSRIDDLMLLSNTTGILFEVVNGTGSFAQTIMHGIKCVVGTNGTGFSAPQNSILQRGWYQGTFWVADGQTAVNLDCNIEDSTFRFGIEGAGGSSTNTALTVGSHLLNMDQASISLLLTGTINTSVNNPSSMAFHYYPNANAETIVQTQGTVYISYKRHGDSTDRVRIEGLTAGGRIQFGNGANLDVNMYRSAADILSSDDQFRPASLKTQTKAGTPVDGDITGGAADGNIVVDTTANKIWVRTGGAWKSVAVS